MNCARIHLAGHCTVKYISFGGESFLEASHTCLIRRKDALDSLDARLKRFNLDLTPDFEAKRASKALNCEWLGPAAQFSNSTCLNGGRCWPAVLKGISQPTKLALDHYHLYLAPIQFEFFANFTHIKMIFSGSNALVFFYLLAMFKDTQGTYVHSRLTHKHGASKGKKHHKFYHPQATMSVWDAYSVDDFEKVVQSPKRTEANKRHS
ncbi:hypothetical protein O181_007725 [Austropuccinia psidii MF-1]|uniref:Uncharacterized protein n=1 Tax=Austropuccinia psidii MF-1 TaxID=1389203 RepID=A0A9Q3GI69_9BASI|nr:hypothetical protein [Austropuccinia psidii MF-1]